MRGAELWKKKLKRGHPNAYCLLFSTANTYRRPMSTFSVTPGVFILALNGTWPYWQPVTTPFSTTARTGSSVRFWQVSGAEAQAFRSLICALTGDWVNSETTGRPPPGFSTTGIAPIGRKKLSIALTRAKLGSHAERAEQAGVIIPSPAKLAKQRL